MKLYFKTGFFAVVLREIRRIASNPVYIFFSVILPLVFILFFAALFKSGVLRELPVAVCDADNSSLSREIVRMIDAIPSARIVARVNDLNEGKILICRKKIYALVLIPSGFEKDVQRNMSPSIVGFYNNLFLGPSATLNSDIYSTLESISEKIKIKNISTSGMPKKLADPIRLDMHKLFNPYINYQYYLCSGFMPTIFQVFVIIMTVFALGIEIKSGTAGEWFETAGGSLVKSLSGKLFMYLIIFLIIGFFMNSLLFSYVKMPMDGSYLLIIAANVFFILSDMAVGIILVAVFANLRYTVSLTALYTAFAFTFSGYAYPLSSMPVLLKYIGMGFPMTHYLKIFISQALWGAPYYTVLPSFLAFAIFMLFPFLFYHRWSVIICNEKYWGRI